ncbi:hypothetical protein CAEBREN_10610 [Caenorhabditis brenneri]|uniref:adenosine deaminase n=1 Tax=Caenorhabditis brenneri TaxID=135651 RepID=G0NMS7_CAEBE|nr:hypothetical protein CAEBREN_10610 [Caenorhabditis brenneri]
MSGSQNRNIEEISKDTVASILEKAVDPSPEESPIFSSPASSEYSPTKQRGKKRWLTEEQKKKLVNSYDNENTPLRKLIQVYRLSTNEESARIEISRIRKQLENKTPNKQQAYKQLSERVGTMIEHIDEVEQVEIHERFIQRLGIQQAAAFGLKNFQGSPSWVNGVKKDHNMVSRHIDRRITTSKRSKSPTPEEKVKKFLATEVPRIKKKYSASHIFNVDQTGIRYELTSNRTITKRGRKKVAREVTAENIVEAVKRGFDRGEKQFGIKARSIICCIRGLDKKFPQTILDLATDFKHLGIVAIDVAGTAHGADEQYEPEVVAAFQEAFKRGVHRTVHAGESGGPKEVHRAIHEMHAERIGHGYRVMRDEQMYIENFVKSKSIHLESCPYSSVMTGAVPLDWKNHPIIRWAKDDVNFSISRDDPTCFDNSMLSELALAHEQIGLDIHQLWKAQLNAAKACFLPDDEKAELVKLVEAGEPKL